MQKAPPTGELSLLTWAASPFERRSGYMCRPSGRWEDMDRPPHALAVPPTWLRSRALLAFIGLLLAPVGLVASASTASAAGPALSARPITWNILGLDSNAPATSGPDTFPVGARICNTGDAAATAVAASLVFDSANPYIQVAGPDALTLPNLAAGACTDAYYNVVVSRTTAAFDTSRRYRIVATAAGGLTAATPANRELYVEKLISQNRNAVLGVSGSALTTAPSLSGPGAATVVVGQIYTFRVRSKTATGGYEQLEAFMTFPATLFRVLSTTAVYAQPTGATNDTLYADACGFDNNIGPRPSTGTYLSCVGPVGYAGGKAGGSPIVTDYTVQVVRAGSGVLNTLIYDFSGSSFHYNSDFGANAASVNVTAVNPPPAATPTAQNDSGTVVSGQVVTVDVLANDTPGTGPSTVTKATNPANGTATCTNVGCTYTPNSGFVGTDSFTYTLTDGNGATSTATVTITVTAPPAAATPTARNDSASVLSGATVTVDVLANDTPGTGPSTVTKATTPNNGTATCTASDCG